MVFQIGFLTEWQMYAQKIEGDSWRGEKLDKGKIDKMSGMHEESSDYVFTLMADKDQQLGQLYELMQAIQKKDQNDGEQD